MGSASTRTTRSLVRLNLTTARSATAADRTGRPSTLVVILTTLKSPTVARSYLTRRDISTYGNQVDNFTFHKLKVIGAYVFFFDQALIQDGRMTRIDGSGGSTTIAGK